ncbi:DTW domain-containing protein [Bacteriovoracaceae bacterium]|nr:DTW domain-containing protein [Bacteriovoracaceae bacterium]
MSRCWKCFRAIDYCYCTTLIKRPTNTEFIFLMHPKEARKQKTGTGRLSHIILPNSQLLIGISFENDPILQDRLNDPKRLCYLLYPGKNSFPIDNLEVDYQSSPNTPRSIILIDGTWPCAKKMMRLTPSIHSIPRWSFTQLIQSEFRIKQQPMKGFLSTIEACYHLLLNLEKRNIETSSKNTHELKRALEILVKQQVDCANDPLLPSYRKSNYKKSEERKESKKWEKRSIIFRDDK